MAQGLARAGFDLDLEFGQAREESLAWVIGDAKIEVKSDQACRRTGNLFVEYRQKGRPSGIAVTEADYWAFEYDDGCWLLVPTDKLKRICRRVWRDHPEQRKPGGDYDRYDGVLVPISWLVPNGKPDWKDTTW